MLLDFALYIIFILVILTIAYLLMRGIFKLQDHHAHQQNRRVEIAWTELNMIESQRKVILNQWYTRQISTRQRDILLTPLIKRHQEAETNWIIEGKK